MAMSLIYNDTAPGSSENSTTTATFQTQLSDLSRFKDGLMNENYGTFENDFWLLDGSFSIMPDNDEDVNITCWSENIANGSGESSDSGETLIREYSEYFESNGITLTFDTFNNEYPSLVSIKWFKDDVVVSRKSFKIDSSTYFCENHVDLYNKVEISFFLFPPNRRLRVSSILDGTSYTFTNDTLKSASVYQEVSPISDSISENTLNCSIFTDNNSLTFQNMQSIYAYFNGKLLGKYFITSATHESKKIWTIEATDYIGALETIETYGDWFYNGISFDEYLQKILGNYYKYCVIDESLKNKLIQGYIGITTAREAFTYACFAVGAAVSTANSDKIRIFVPQDSEKTIDDDRLYYGATIDSNEIVKRCTLSMHYTNESLEQQTLFNQIITDTTTVLFDGGYASLIFKNCEVVESSANHAIITPTSTTEKVKITGSALSDFSKTVYKENSNITSSMKQKNISVTNCPFVVEDNADDILNRIFEYYSKNRKLNVQFVVNNEQVGDVVNVKSPFGAVVKGRILSMDLSGVGKLVGQAVILLEVR